MKKVVRFFVLLTCMLVAVAQAQVTTTITPKVQLFPSSGMSYVEDPSQYFNVIMTNTGSESRQVYISFKVSCDFSAAGSNFFLQSPNNMAPPQPLTLGANETRVITMQDFKMLMSHINGRDIQMSGISWQDALMLPEGNYQICIKTYYWDHAGTVPTPVEAGPEGCCYFTICYSGSAPEFTSPIIGQSGGNINVINPTANQADANSNFDASSGSDSRSGSSYTVLTPSRQVVFSWTGVISNCITNSNVNYNFKLVEVDPTQTAYEAIEHSRTIYTLNTGSRTTCIIDTLKDLNVNRFQLGHTYAAIVQAVPKSQNLLFKLGNEGKSQIIVFTWGQPSLGPVPRILPPGNSIVRTLDSMVSDNKADVLASLRNSYLIMPVVDDDAADVLVGKFPSENTNRPKNALSLIDGLYYRLNDKEKLKVSWLPMRGDSLTKVEYRVNLYEYIGGDVSLSAARPPLKSYKIEKTNGFDVTNIAYIDMPEKWDTVLDPGRKYFLVLEAASHYKYRRTTNYTETIIKNGNTTTNKYSKISIMEGTDFFYSNEVFQWGYDSSLLETVKLAQLTYPVDMSKRTGDFKPGETEVEEVFLNSAFEFRWTEADNVLDCDSVTYNLRIAKLKKGFLPSMVKDTMLFYKNLKVTQLTDTLFKDSLKVGEQYVAIVETRIKQVSADPYIIPNKGRSWAAVFKIGKTEEMTATIDPSSECYSATYSSINKKDTLRPQNIEDIKKMELNMNGFKVVFEKVDVKTDSIKDKKTKKTFARKSYYGEGYIVWSPFALNTRIKVKLDSILFNSDHEVFTGCATTIAADSSMLLPMDFSNTIGSWTNNKINEVYGKYGQGKDIQKYVNYFNKPSYTSIGGLFGAGDASASPAFYLPLKINSQDFYLPDDGCNVILSINNMYLSPRTALMNLFAVFYSQEDNIYIPMVATNICMQPNSFFPGFDRGIDLYLAKDIEMELSDGYHMTIKRATTLGNMEDGTVISFRSATEHERAGYEKLNLEFEFDLASSSALAQNQSGLLALNPKTGIPQKGTPVKAGAFVTIRSWQNWMARISIDPFALEDFQDMAFVPGRNLWYDHSIKENPTKFPKNYQSSTGKGTAWQGFFMEDLGFVMSDKIGTVFGAGDTNVKPMYKYSYGPNGEIKDSSEVAFTKQCLGFRIANTIIDAEGFTTDIQGVNIVDASAKNAGSWAFSIDTIGVKVLKGKFNRGYIVGTAQIPLMTGRIGYNCTIATDSLTFGLSTRKTETLGFDLWLAKLSVQKSYFRLVHKYEPTAADSVHPQTAIDLKLNGKINIDFNKLKIPVSFAMVKFENFTLRNFNDAKDTNAKRIGDSDLWFYMGDWSKASPQHYLTSNATNEDFGGSIGGFTFSVKNLKSLNSKKSGSRVTLGFQAAISVGFKTGPQVVNDSTKSDVFSLDATCGFGVWGTLDYKSWDIIKEESGGFVDSVCIETNCFSVFKLKGKLIWIGNQTPDETFGEGMFGSLMVTIMDKVEIAMAAAFGTKGKDSSSYKWWMLQGAATGFEIPVPPIKFTGFGGGFAYNMTVKPGSGLADAKTHELLNGEDGGSLATKMVTGSLSQCEFIPEKDSWVAKAGISLALANKKLMNADGILTLRVSEGKFSGFMIDVTAYILTDTTSAPATAAVKDKNINTTIKARALMGYEKTKDYHYFKFGLCVKGGIDLTIMLKDSAKMQSLDGVKDKLKCMGDNIMKDVACTFKDLTNVVEVDSTSYKAKTDTSAASGIGGGIDILLPIEFEVKAYKEGNALGKKANSADWYFCIGKPNAQERVKFNMWANLVVFETMTEFTFYFITGNSFDYQIPPLDSEVYDFFFGGSPSGKQVNTSTVSTINRQSDELKRMYDETPTFANAGGFAMGMTYKSRVKYELFLYIDVMAALGFDVALLDTKGQSCEGYDHIGKNDFYAMGQLYAMLKGSAGLSINLGFWKGKLELCSLGIGALLKGGGPRPSWAFGLLRLKASLLNGMVSINTSVDFRVGDVCVPGAGDPLANVNFFENVSPGFKNKETALKEGNAATPIAGGVIVSNMPWNQEVTLVSSSPDGQEQDARKFIFVIEKDRCKHETSKNNGVSWTTANKNTYKIESYASQVNTMIFQDNDGGFEEKSLQRWHFTARAFEYRTAFDTKNKNLRDTVYDHENNFVAKTTFPSFGTWGWYNPKYASDKDSAIHGFRQDTVIYFNIDSLPNSLYNQVVYTWPYNGDPSVPKDEFREALSQNYELTIFLSKGRSELFDPGILESKGKEMQFWLFKGYGGLNSEPVRINNFNYYSNANTPYIRVQVDASHIKEGQPYMLRMILVNKEGYQNTIDKLMASQRVSTRTDYELTSQNWDKVYASHQASMNTSSAGSYVDLGNFNEFSNSRVEKLNEQIEKEGFLHGLAPDVGNLGDIFGKDILIPKPSGRTPVVGSRLGSGLSPIITNTPVLGKEVSTVQINSPASVVVTNSLNDNSGVLATNTLNNTVLETVSSRSSAKIISGSRLRSAAANSNTGNNTSSTGQMVLQNRGQMVQNASLSSSSVAQQSDVNAADLKNTRNLLKVSTLTPTVQKGRNLVPKDLNPSNNLIIAADSANLLVVNPPVVKPIPSQNTTSINASVVQEQGTKTDYQTPVIITVNIMAGDPEPVVFYGTASVASNTSTSEEDNVVETFFSGDNRVVANRRRNSNVEEYMYEKLKEDYTKQGGDTSMLYKRTSLEEYAIAHLLGDTIYDLCFKTDPNYSTYDEMFRTIMSCYNSGIDPIASTSSKSSLVFLIKTSASTAQQFGWYSYLFVSQKPNDPLRYNENVTLPAIATFKLATDPSHRTAAMAKHLFLMTQFSMMKDASNRYTNAPVKRVPHQINIAGPADKFTGWDDIKCEYGKEFFDGTKGGIIRDYSRSWNNLDLRSYSVTRRSNSNPAFFEPCGNGLGNNLSTPDAYRSYFEEQCWAVPDLLSVTSTQNKAPVITIKSFESKESEWEDYRGSRTEIATVTITDKATPAMYEDIQMFYKFFKKCTEIAAYPLSLGYSHKTAILKQLYTAEKAHSCLQFDENFPYTINMSLPWTHYFISWSNLFSLGNNLNPNDVSNNPEVMHMANSGWQYYSWLWFHYKKAPTTTSKTEGMTLELNTNNDRTVPHWYTNMNDLSSNNILYVKIAYLSDAAKRAAVAKQIKDNLLGSGDVINISSFQYNRVTPGSWKLNNYEIDNSWIKTDNDTKMLTFPKPKEVEKYIKG